MRQPLPGSRNHRKQASLEVATVQYLLGGCGCNASAHLPLLLACCTWLHSPPPKVSVDPDKVVATDSCDPVSVLVAFHSNPTTCPITKVWPPRPAQVLRGN